MEVNTLEGVTCRWDHTYGPIWMVRLNDVPCCLVNEGSPLAGRAAGQAVCTRLVVSGEGGRLPRTRRKHVPALGLLEDCGDRGRQRRGPWTGSDRAEGGARTCGTAAGGASIWMEAPTAPLATTRISTRVASRAAWTTACIEVSGVWGDDVREYGGAPACTNTVVGMHSSREVDGAAASCGRVRGGGDEGGRRGKENVREIQPVAL